MILRRRPLPGLLAPRMVTFSVPALHRSSADPPTSAPPLASTHNQADDATPRLRLRLRVNLQALTGLADSINSAGHIECRCNDECPSTAHPGSSDFKQIGHPPRRSLLKEGRQAFASSSLHQMPLKHITSQPDKRPQPGSS
ncbi:unnamed protein product [Gadus morhua 'NCC']